MLAEVTGKDATTIRRWLDSFPLPWKHHAPRSCVCIFDATYFDRGDGMLIARDPHAKENLYGKEIVYETKEEYALAKRDIEARGYSIAAVVLDGRRGIPKVLRVFRYRSASSISYRSCGGSSHCGRRRRQGESCWRSP